MPRHSRVPTDCRGTPTLPAAERFVRAEHIPAGYSPWRHMALTLAHRRRAGDARARCWRRARGPPTGCWRPSSWWSRTSSSGWSTATRCTARCARGSCTRNHALLHHLAFTDGNMAIDPPRRAGPDHDALVHDDRPVRRRVAGHGGGGLAARPRPGRRVPAGRRRLLPDVRDAARPLPPARRDAGPRRHRPAARCSAGCRRTTATTTSSAGWPTSTST